jgi:hypothetical protein
MTSTSNAVFQEELYICIVFATVLLFFGLLPAHCRYFKKPLLSDSCLELLVPQSQLKQRDYISQYKKVYTSIEHERSGCCIFFFLTKKEILLGGSLL